MIYSNVIKIAVGTRLEVNFMTLLTISFGGGLVKSTFPLCDYSKLK